MSALHSPSRRPTQIAFLACALACFLVGWAEAQPSPEVQRLIRECAEREVIRVKFGPMTLRIPVETEPDLTPHHSFLRLCEMTIRGEIPEGRSMIFRGRPRYFDTGVRALAGLAALELGVRSSSAQALETYDRLLRANQNYDSTSPPLDWVRTPAGNLARGLYIVVQNPAREDAARESTDVLVQLVSDQ